MIFDVFGVLSIVVGVFGAVYVGFAAILIMVATFKLPKIDLGAVVLSFGVVLILLVIVSLFTFTFGWGLHHFGFMLNHFNSPFLWISNYEVKF